MPAKNEQSGPTAWLLRRADQAALAAAVVVCLASMVGWWLWQGGGQGRIIHIEQAEPLEATFAVDINNSYWFELAQIPDIGETLGRRIVAEREQNGPYLDHDDMRQRVSGIGPKTLEQMQPYLLPMPPSGTIVGDDSARAANFP